jgi:hypothetical protein
MINQLVSFGNFMLAELTAEWLDNPEAIKDFGAWLRNRETTLADLQKWEEKNPGSYLPKAESIIVGD